MIPLGKEELVGILGLKTSSHREDGVRLSKDLARLAVDLDYGLFLYYARADPNEWDRLSRQDREVMNLLWRRLPPLASGELRMFFSVLASPAECDVGNALFEELNPHRLIPMDETREGARRPIEEVRVFRLLRGMWSAPNVAHGIFAAMDWGLSFPDLEERKCSLQQMLDDLYHWFDKNGKWTDKTYYVTK